ncbi:MAG: GNAT family N-acetyltransferase [Anaerolineae bacterium]|nr:GNAT family N-acetyltransferase [Anaerolineae bacterium]
MTDETTAGPRIRELRPEESELIAGIAALAWAPIYEHFARLQEEALGAVARRSSVENKREQVISFAERHPEWVRVTEIDGRVVAFVTFTLDQGSAIGTIGNNAVHPDYAGRGMGSTQYTYVLELFRREGMKYATVITGLDDAHAAARRAYEKAGFRQVLPSVEYMLAL